MTTLRTDFVQFHPLNPKRLSVPDGSFYAVAQMSQATFPGGCDFRFPTSSTATVAFTGTARA